MSQISIRLFAGAAEALGEQETLVTGNFDLAGLINELARGDSRRREVLDQCSYFVDGEHHRSLDTALPDTCQVDVLPPFAGG